MRLGVLALVVVLAWVVAAPARADAPDPDRVTHYRAYTLAADGAAVALLLAGVAIAPDHQDAGAALIDVGVIGGLAATPIVHGVRGHGARTTLSLLLRVGLGAVGATIGTRLVRDPDVWDALIEGGLIGIAGGYAAAAGIDALTLTDERGGRDGWGPQVVVAPGRVQLGVVAAF